MKREDVERLKREATYGPWGEDEDEVLCAGDGRRVAADVHRDGDRALITAACDDLLAAANEAAK